MLDVEGQFCGGPQLLLQRRPGRQLVAAGQRAQRDLGGGERAGGVVAVGGGNDQGLDLALGVGALVDG
ncbi:hypothetical protein AB0J43_02120 [Nonomuraea fuscirosea]